MREIKFRVFTKEKNRLVYPEWITFFKDFAEFRVKEEYGYTIYRPSYKDIDIMQYTGLKDKNGIKIYEGDIVLWIDSYGNERKDKVFFESGGFRINNPLFEIADYDELEVIGNICETPKLLKEEKEYEY